MKKLFTLLAAMIAIMSTAAVPQRLVSNPKKIQPDRKFERTINDHMGMKPVTSKHPRTFVQTAYRARLL